MGKYKDSLPGGKNGSRSSRTSQRYPGGRQNVHTYGGRYGYRLEYRRQQAAELARLRAERTPEEQLALLDRRLGPGQGAVKERARLNKLLNR